jgi:hypothetical protein
MVLPWLAWALDWEGVQEAVRDLTMRRSCTRIQSPGMVIRSPAAQCLYQLSRR